MALSTSPPRSWPASVYQRVKWRWKWCGSTFQLWPSVHDWLYLCPPLSLRTIEVSLSGAPVSPVTWHSQAQWYAAGSTDPRAHPPISQCQDWRVRVRGGDRLGLSVPRLRIPPVSHPGREAAPNSAVKAGVLCHPQHRPVGSQCLLGALPGRGSPAWGSAYYRSWEELQAMKFSIFPFPESAEDPCASKLRPR